MDGAYPETTPSKPTETKEKTLFRTPPTPLNPLGYVMPLFGGVPDLTSRDEFSDIALVVEGRKLYTCKGILASASPVMRKLFGRDFKEKDATEVPLPGKNFDDVYEMLLCISPAIQKPVDAENVLTVLPLADEYQMSKLKHDCQVWLMSQVHQDSPVQTQVRCLITATRYHLDTLQQYTLDLVASNFSMEQMDSLSEDGLDQSTLVQILTRRVQVLEKNNDKLTKRVTSWRKKCEDNEECLKKMGREKMTIKRALDEVEGAWELKGSDTRCIDPVHIYGPRNYSCEKCTRQVNTYIQGKVLHLLNRGSTWSDINWPQ